MSTTKASVLEFAILHLLEGKQVEPEERRWKKFTNPRSKEGWFFYLGPSGTLRYGPELKKSQSMGEGRIGELYHLARNMMEVRGEFVGTHS